LRQALLALALLAAPALGNTPARTPPEWSRDAVIYQVNTRQFTPEGTLKAAEAQLPRLKALGVEIIWLMPVNPIGKVNRKGSLGSPYSVADYRAVNPELGTLEDLKRFTAAAHALGLKVVIDWVANHSAWDNWLVEKHPDWYARDWNGKFRPTPWWDWSDIIEFDYAQAGLRDYMAESLLFWVREANIDGFRADVACYVPEDFWAGVRAKAEALKPGLWWLAECESRDIHARAFDASYGWQWGDTLARIARGEADVNGLRVFYAENERKWPVNAQRMIFTSNHDKNSWEGTEFERFGPALTNALVLSFVSEGIPLVYNGQEAGNERRLAFFERDPIVWRDHPNGALLRRLAELKRANPALHNAPWGGRMVQAVTNDLPQVLAFVRQVEGNKVLAMFNMSGAARRVNFADALPAGRYTDFDTGKACLLYTSDAADDM
jgi:glycosidase